MKNVAGLENSTLRSYLRVSQATGQVNILIFILKINFSPCMPINFVMQGKCLFSDILRACVGDQKKRYQDSPSDGIFCIHPTVSQTELYTLYTHVIYDTGGIS